jgi:cell division protein FtsA
MLKSHAAVGSQTGIITPEDTARLMESVQEIDIPADRELLHVVPLGFRVDGQENIKVPVGMQGNKLELDVNLITIPANAAKDLRNCLANIGVDIAHLVLNPLASAKAVLTESELEMGAIMCDIGGGSTDIAIYIDSTLKHAAGLPVNGNHITSDIGYVLHLPFADAEQVKLKFGHALMNEVKPDEVCEFSPSGKEKFMKFNRQELADIIQARGEEIYKFVFDEIKSSGFLGSLPAGVVLTGGASLLPGMKALGREILGMPVRIAIPENLIGLVDKIHSPAFSTSVGLLRWAAELAEADAVKNIPKRPRSARGSPLPSFTGLRNFLRMLAGNSSTDAPPPDSKKPNAGRTS